MKKIFQYIILFFFSLEAGAQVQLSLSNAIDTALQNNFDIRIAKVSTKISAINNTWAPALPTVNAAGSENSSLYNLKQKTSSGLDITRDSVRSNALNASVTANLVLFNGFRIIATKSRLSMLQKQSELLLNQQIQNTMADVMVTYYDILRQQSYLGIIQSSLDVSRNKLEIIKGRSNVGMANEADLLQAQMDLNLEQQNLKSQQLIIDQAKTDLLQLMGVKHFFQVTINDSILYDENISKDSVINFLENNQQYLSAYQQVKINEQIVKEVRSQRYPSIRASAGYNFSYNNSAAGFNLFTQTYGPVVGATIQVPIFNGTVYKRQQDVARLNVETARLQKESLLLTLTTQAIKTYLSYESAMQQLTSQKISYRDAAKLVSIVVQKFRLNEATILDVKAAQSSFESSGYLYVNLQYSAKIAEIELKRLVYKLGY